MKKPKINEALVKKLTLRAEKIRRRLQRGEYHIPASSVVEDLEALLAMLPKAKVGPTVRAKIKVEEPDKGEIAEVDEDETKEYRGKK